MPLEAFHPIIQRWFAERFAAPTEAQRLGWPAIQNRQNTIVSAPTGSGKTLTAFLAGIDRLLKLALTGGLRDQTYLVYISPLKALSNDIERNLRGPLAEIVALAGLENPGCPEVRAMVRTGDTPAHQRQQMVRKPPHILVTTPESLYLLLTGKRSRENLRRVETVVVDEIHAVARDKRGSHLSLSLERLEALCTVRPLRIGLSATQNPLEELARFLVGSAAPLPVLVDIGHLRDMDLGVEVPARELEAVCTHEHWAEVYERLVELIGHHRSTLVFVNTRKMAERIAHQLTQRLGEDQVVSHHGSLSHTSRHWTEQRLKTGNLKAVVATASLELGIDIGHVNLVCQIGTPRSVATFLQRVGRAGHSLGLTPKGRLFALSREELIECAALVRAARAGRLDRIEIPQAPLDILAQQIVAAVACEDWDEDGLFELCRRAYPFRNLAAVEYQAVLEMLGEGISHQRGRHGAYVHWDRVNRRLRARKGARLTAITCGGAIPEIADYRVVTADDNRTFVGTLDEDFAIESNAGDIFLLGNSSWRVKHVRGGEVAVLDAHGAPPTIPFWRGEAPGRTLELSAEVGILREEIVARNGANAAKAEALREENSALANGDSEGASDHCSQSAISWLMQECSVPRHAAVQALGYVSAHYAATRMVPTQKRLLFERFFDESGGMQLVVHAPFGTRINRAWGLALRKRFCRTFDFELQASADDNGIVLSMGAQHSFPLEQMFKLVPSRLATEVLIQAFLAVPFFTTRWRWNATRALQMKRASSGKRVPPHLQRMRADDLLSAVFPAQTACQENVVGDIAVPDHPLVRQTVHDCLHEASDADGLLTVLRDIEAGAIEVIGLDSREPSPFAHQLLNANPYAFLDDAPLEERRARAVTMRRTLSVEALRDLGRLSPEAIDQVKAEAWPLVRNADELHDVLLSHGILPPAEGRLWLGFYEELCRAGRAAKADAAGGLSFWTAAERLPLVHAIWPTAQLCPVIAAPAGVRRDWPREEAIQFVVRGRMECVGPTNGGDLAQAFGLDRSDIEIALAGLEGQGIILRGHFTAGSASPGSGADDVEWCDRRLLARIHRLTMEGLRRQIAPVSPEQFMCFLVRHLNVHPQAKFRGQAGVLALIEKLEGYEAPAGHWEKYLLPCRIEGYNPAWLDNLTFMGQAAWGRLRPLASLLLLRGTEHNGRPMKAFTRSTPISLVKHEHLGWLLPAEDESGPLELIGAGGEVAAKLGSNASAAYAFLQRHGALFANQLATLLQATASQVEDVLGELAAAGLATSDGYPALRSLIGVNMRRRGQRRRFGLASHQPVGRWTLLRSALTPPASAEQRVEPWCRLLLRRYGVMFRDILANESAAPPWHELVRTYRRLEARGEIRGGRFVSGVAGEQYALADVIPILRSTASDSSNEASLALPATDPLNLSGRIDSGPRVPALPGHFVAITQGRIAMHEPKLPRRLGQPPTEQGNTGFSPTIQSPQQAAL